MPAATAAGVAAIARAAEACEAPEESNEVRAANMERLMSALHDYSSINSASVDAEVQQTFETPLDLDTAGTPTAASTSSLLGSTASRVWPHEHTRKAVKAGRVIVVCNGPVCLKNASKNMDPVRNCSTCTHLFCKKCCILFQQDGGLPCSQASHSTAAIPPVNRNNLTNIADNLTGVATASGIRITNTQPIENLGSTGYSYNPNLPLRQTHFEKSQHAKAKVQNETNRLIQKKAVETVMKTSVTILYWKDNEKYSTLCIPCPSYPIFTLSNCSAGILKLMSLHDDSDKLVEAFNPVNNTWQIHIVETAQDVSKVPKLLYRSLGNASDEAEGMEEQMRDLVDWVQPRKHYIELAEPQRKRPRLITSSPSKFASGTSYNTPVKTEDPSNDIISIESGNESTSSDSSDLPPVSEMFKKPRRKMVLKNRAGVKVPESLSTHKGSTNRKRKQMGPELADDSDSAVEILATAPSSGHAPWPFKYVCAMADGFNKMETMKGDLPSRFTAAFDVPFPSSKATWFAAIRAWLAADDDLKDAYIYAGVSKEGLWKNFQKDVREEFDGKLPGRRDLAKQNIAGTSGNHGRDVNAKGKGKATTTKKIPKKDDLLPAGVKVKKEPVEVIVLDSE